MYVHSIRAGSEYSYEYSTRTVDKIFLRIPLVEIPFIDSSIALFLAWLDLLIGSHTTQNGTSRLKGSP